MPRALTSSTVSTPAMTTGPTTLVWLRRDLRLEDHAALAAALQHPESIQDAGVRQQVRRGPRGEDLAEARQVSWSRRSRRASIQRRRSDHGA